MNFLRSLVCSLWLPHFSRLRRMRFRSVNAQLRNRLAYTTTRQNSPSGRLCQIVPVKRPSLPESEPAQGGRVDGWVTSCPQSWDWLNREIRVARCAGTRYTFKWRVRRCHQRLVKVADKRGSTSQTLFSGAMARFREADSSTSSTAPCFQRRSGVHYVVGENNNSGRTFWLTPRLGLWTHRDDRSRKAILP